MLLKFIFCISFLLCLGGVGFCSLIGDGVSVVEAWHRMSNFKLLTAVSLWTSTFYGIAKIRSGTKLNASLAKSLAFMVYSVNVACLFLITLHFAPETEAIFDFIVNVIERIFK